MSVYTHICMQQTLPNYFNKIGNKKAKGNKECPNDQIDAFVGFFFFFFFVCLFFYNPLT